VAIVALSFLAPQLHAQGTRLLRYPTVSATQIAFSHAGDIWVVSREGGDARRLSSFPGLETLPQLSPDGKLVAFTAEYGGNTDVYVVSVEGGEPRRLTWHPLPDVSRGWTPDGKRIVFWSGRASAPRSYNGKLWTVPIEGGWPEPLPMPRASSGMFSPDGKSFTYRVVFPWDEEWRNYRGGQANPIRVVNLSDLAMTKLPWDGSNDTDPVWLGDTIYFLSDRDYAVNLYGFDRNTNQLRQLTHYKDFDAKHLNAGGGTLVYEQGGYLHLFDPATGTDRQLVINVRGDLPWALPHWADVGDQLTNPSLSPTGVRALFEARGEIFTVPVEKGDWRNLTRSPGVADRNPVWSPDGKQIAWFSDASGEYRLMIGSQDGLEKPREIVIDKPTFYFTPTWSPDGKWIACTDEGLNLWIIDVATGKATRVDTDRYAHPERTVNPTWSPDSKWLAYAKRLESQFHEVRVYSVKDQTSRPITDGLSDAVSPAWSLDGKYLYFLASTDFALNSGWLDLSSYDRPINRGVYLTVLNSSAPSPLLPESDEEGRDTTAAPDTSKAPAKPEKKQGKKEKAKSAADSTKTKNDSVAVKIDFPGIGQRILALDVPERGYVTLRTAADGAVFYAEAIRNETGITLHRYDLKKRKAVDFSRGVTSFSISADGKKVLYQSGTAWTVVGTGEPPKEGAEKLNTAVRMRLDPQAEWRQIFREAWRIERDFFYVKNLHGADWDKVYTMYSPWVEHVGHRSDLTHLLDILGGELSVGHSFTGGGDLPQVPKVPIGMLGADLVPENGRYRIAHIYTGENWNPGLRAPLSEPGVKVSEGDYLLAVNGVELRAPTEPYSLFEGTAGRQTVLRINNKPTIEGSRLVTVVPVEGEGALRSRAWVEGNRRLVDSLSKGRLAYVWVPNTADDGYTYFNRYYFAQQGRLGAVVDERFNEGGYIADYVVDLLARSLRGFFNNPVADHRPFMTPAAGIPGPKVMLINEMSGSGGDMLPYMFRQMKLGPLIGMKTWGGLVGIWDAPPLIDGGYITAPRGGFYDLNGHWDVENVGIAPDIEVEETPLTAQGGKDPQLERAVAEALKLLDASDVRILPEPPPPVKVRRPE
jgi:tricorn protease